MVLREIERLVGSGYRWGESKSPEDDPIRITQNLSLAFEGREIAAIHSGVSGQPPRLLQNVVSFAGPSGPMPLHFAELVRERAFLQGDPVLSRFLDMLLHRVLSLYYRAWALNRIEVSADHPIEDDGVLKAILAMTGLSWEHLQNRGTIDPRSVAVRLGELSRSTRGPDELEKQLCHYFEVPVKVEPFVSSVTPISKSGRWRLGRYSMDSTMRLGAGLPIGKTTISLSNRFRVVIGPLELEDYVRFLPEGKSRARLEDWILLYVGKGIDWDLQLLMKSKSATGWCLGRRGELRRDSWIGSARPEVSAKGYHRRFEQLSKLD